MIIYHICEIETELTQGKFPEDGSNIWVYYDISASAFTNHVVTWLMKVFLIHSQKQHCVFLI